MSAATQSITITKILILLALAFTLGFLIAYWLLRPQPPNPRNVKTAEPDIWAYTKGKRTA